MPSTEVGTDIHFADGTKATVFRVTTQEHLTREEPVLLVVEFRLRGVRREWQHAIFRVESWLNTALFAGFPGFVSKRWLDHDDLGRYRGVYQWDGQGNAEAYVASLWWVLAIVAVRDSIHSIIVPGVVTEDVLADPSVLHAPTHSADWWRPTA
jgi:hypothetical protein